MEKTNEKNTEDLNILTLEGIDADSYNEYVCNNKPIEKIDIGNFPVLTPKEERDLFIRYNSGDVSVKNKIILCNLKLVVSIAKRYINSNYPFEDIVQEGNLGLLAAVERFDVKRNIKFSTYATYWIEQAITRAIAEKSLVVRYPYNQVYKINLINKVKRGIFTEKGRNATIDELVEKTKLSKETILKTLKNYRKTGSLNYSVNTEEEKSELIDFVIDENVNIESSITDKELSITLCSALDSLIPKKKIITALRYGGNKFLSDNEKEIIKIREIINKNNIKSIIPLEITDFYKKSISEIYDEIDYIIIELYKENKLKEAFKEDNYEIIKQVILYNLIFSNNPIDVKTYKEVKDKYRKELQKESVYITYDALTLKKVSDLFDISYQAIGQLESNSLKQLKKGQTGKKIKVFL